MSEIEWDKITQKPDKKYPVPGEFLLEQRKHIELQEQQIAKHLATMDKLNLELKSSKEELETRATKIKEMVEKTGEMNEKIEEINKRVEEIKNENQILKSENENMKTESQKLLEEVKDLKENNSVQENLVKQKDDEIKKSLEQVEQQKQNIAELEGKLKSLPSENEINEMREKNKNLPSPEEIEELKKRPSPDEVDQLLFNKDEEIETLNKEVNSLKSQLEELSVKIKTAAPIPIAVPVTPTEIKTPSKIPSVVPETVKSVKPSAVPKKAEPGPATTFTQSLFGEESPIQKIPTSKDSKFVEQKTSAFAYSEDEGSEKGGLKTRELPQEVIEIFGNISVAIQGGIRAGELCRLLEESRDRIANIFGFSLALKQMGDVAKKLKKAPSNAQIDETSVQVFLKKIEEWKQKLTTG